jgi:hypothetical protein
MFVDNIVARVEFVQVALRGHDILDIRGLSLPNCEQLCPSSSQFSSNQTRDVRPG